MQTLSFDIRGMTCGGCTRGVQRALSKFDRNGDRQARIRRQGAPAKAPRTGTDMSTKNKMALAFDFTLDCIDAKRLARRIPPVKEPF